MTITKSPLPIDGVNVGRCFPRRTCGDLRREAAERAARSVDDVPRSPIRPSPSVRTYSSVLVSSHSGSNIEPFGTPPAPGTARTPAPPVPRSKASLPEAARPAHPPSSVPRRSRRAARPSDAPGAGGTTCATISIDASPPHARQSRIAPACARSSRRTARRTPRSRAFPRAAAPRRASPRCRAPARRARRGPAAAATACGRLSIR